MRIRKQLRISSPPQIVPNSPATHVCELNRSLWDVIPLTTLQSEYGFQAEDEDEYTYHTVGEEPVYSPDSIASLYGNKLVKNVKRDEVLEEGYDEMEEESEIYRRPYVRKKGKKKNEVFNYVRCAKTDGKGWQCKTKAKEGELLCEHHLVQLQNYAHNYNYTSRKTVKDKKVPAKSILAANRKRNSGRISSNSPADYYFYSGFGPWKTKRRGAVETKKEDEELVDANTDQTSSSSSLRDSKTHDRNNDNPDIGVDYMYEDDSDEDDEGGEKRIRKPIKARSLKSLL
ncbi:hypothetical protein ACHQM5_000506 [Ranunculus cassubicifolius]